MGRKPVNVGICIELGCEGMQFVRHLCRRHYRHFHYVSRERERRGCTATPLPPNGTTRVNASGYLIERIGPGKWVLQHRKVMEDSLGRSLGVDETVHHKNGVKTDNQLINLELWASVHPKGQRVQDLIEFANKILEKYDG